MRFLFSTGSLYTYGLDRCFELASAAGFDGVELMVSDVYDTRDPAYIKDLSSRYGISVGAVHSPFLQFAEDWAPDLIGRVGKSVKLAEALGAELVNIHLPRKISYFGVKLFGPFGRISLKVPLPVLGDNRTYRWMLEGCPLPETGDTVILSVENLPATRKSGFTLNDGHWNPSCTSNCHEINRFPAITLDTTHLGTWRLDPLEMYLRWGKRVRHVHLSNYNGKEHRLLNDGYMKLEPLIRRMAQDGYAGFITLEFSPHALHASEGRRRVLPLLSDALECCRRWARL